jgi:hypothetical protein
MVLAAMRASHTISTDDVTQAHTLLSYTERLMPVALGGYGKGKYSDVAHKIQLALRAATKPLTVTDLFKMSIKDLDKPEHLQSVLSGLVRSGQAQVIDGGYLPVQEAVKLRAADKYADWQLLKGIADDAELGDWQPW